MRSPPAPSARESSDTAQELFEHAESFVRLWDRAEDWAVPRIPPSQVKVLGLLGYTGGMNLGELASEIGAIPSSASRLCDRLEAAGLIRREVPTDNRRAVWITATKEGLRRLEAFDQTRREDFAPVLERMSPQARAALLAGLREFSDATRRARSSTA